MTKKDYIIIADAIIDAAQYNVQDKTISNTISLDDLLEKMCELFERDNDKFNPDKFKKYILTAKSL